MQRIQELYYSKHQKTSIDIDLMLDYTRVMYADLLEWRKDFKNEPQTAEAAEKNEDVVTSEAEATTTAASQKNEAATNEEKAASPSTPAVEEHADDAGDEEHNKKEVAEEDADESSEETKEDEDVVAESSEETKEAEEDTDEPAEETKEEDEETPLPAAEHEDDSHPGFLPIERDEPAPKEPEISEEKIVEEEPETVHIDVLQHDASGISFEPPTVAEVVKEIKDEIELEEPATKPELDEKPAPAAAAIPLPNMHEVIEKPKELAFSPQQLTAPVVQPRKDIRSSIGINDKYLFLNELFNNHKSNYEETLDKLNLLSNYDEAVDWIKTKVAAQNRWDMEDATVASFYSLLAKHFSVR